MATTPEQIDLWRQSSSEHERLEFKEAKQQFDNHKLYEYCVALANEGGGRLLGVADKPPRPVVGTQAFSDPVAMAEKLFRAVGFQGLVQFVMNQLPQNETIEGELRKEVKLIPEIVIRELVANALIHQDFAIGGASVMIELARSSP